MIVFYTNKIKENIVVLEGDEAMHCTKTLRRKVGDTVHCIDGIGNFYTGKLIGVSKKSCIINISNIQNQANRADFKLHIAIAPTKNINRLEWFLEKATEIGIDEISPILCQRSERKNIRLDRLNKVLIAATKQSLKYHLPKLNELTKFKDFIKQEFEGQKLIAHCNEGKKVALKNNYSTSKDVLILIGPEGDFSEEEVNLSSKYGFEAIHLGKERLRTETAGLVAVHTVNLINQ